MAVRLGRQIGALPEPFMGRARDELPHRHSVGLTSAPGTSAKFNVIKTELDEAVRYTEPSPRALLYTLLDERMSSSQVVRTTPRL
jgi:hypothetical protein